MACKTSSVPVAVDCFDSGAIGRLRNGKVKVILWKVLIGSELFNEGFHRLDPRLRRVSVKPLNFHRRH